MIFDRLIDTISFMYIDTAKSKRGDKVYVRHLLRTSFREDGKVKHKTIANLGECSPEEIQALKLALKHKGSLSSLCNMNDIHITQGKRIGAILLLKHVAQKIGLTKILGSQKEGALALLQIFARVITQGSRLSALRLTETHACEEVLNISNLNKDALYENLDWLAQNQEKLEKALWKEHLKTNPGSSRLFLYDVTSSYLEGEENELAAYGYNRDKKRGHQQIVIGLLTDQDGVPVSVRVFEGNTKDTQTVSEQIRTLTALFGIKNVTFVGDRGMIKSPQIDELPEGFSYITAISKPEIETLLKENILQYGLFDETLQEVEKDTIRYIFRRNPIRRDEIEQNRTSKLSALHKELTEQNDYLTNHPRALVKTALKALENKATKLKLTKFISFEADARHITMIRDESALLEAAKLDGIYVIKTDILQEDASKEFIHQKYKSLSRVEKAFRTMKTGYLEVRPVFVRKDSRTRGHVFVVMLAYRLVQELEKYWKEIDTPVEECLREIDSISTHFLTLDSSTILKIPQPNERARQLLEAASLTLPDALPTKK